MTPASIQYAMSAGVWRSIRRDAMTAARAADDQRDRKWYVQSARRCSSHLVRMKLLARSFYETEKSNA